MTTPLGQLADPYLCFPSRARGVQFFRDRPVCSERLRRVARRERVVLRVEREAPLSDLATGASLGRLRGQEVPREESQRHDERHGEICRRLLVIPDPVGERLQPVRLSNHRASCRRYRRCHKETVVEVGGGSGGSGGRWSAGTTSPSSRTSQPPKPAFKRAPGVTRTPGQRFRKPLLYPPELQGLSL